MTLCEIFGKWVADLQFSCWLMTYARPFRWGGVEPTTMRPSRSSALFSLAVAARSSPATKHEALEASAVLDHRSQLMLMRSFQE